MKVRFWGVRGSLPTPLTATEITEKLTQVLLRAREQDLSDPRAVSDYVASLPLIMRGTIGGNTPCVEIQSGEQQIIFDAGSGLRPLGEEMMAGPCGRGEGSIHLFLSHLHWDHIQGLPYFSPAYVAGNRITVYCAHRGFERQIIQQQASPHFPIPLDKMGATFHFVPLHESSTVPVGNCTVRLLKQRHPGVSYTFCIDDGHASAVYATDAEYQELDEAHVQRYRDFFKNADALIFDAQYSLQEALFEKDGWGHSTAFIGIDLAAQAGVKRLILFHHEPAYNDQALAALLETARLYRDKDPRPTDLEILLAYEGLELTL
jgi:phosphoribosyl 1,2-cyclic phosphodiesterase